MAFINYVSYAYFMQDTSWDPNCVIFLDKRDKKHNYF